LQSPGNSPSQRMPIGPVKASAVRHKYVIIYFSLDVDSPFFSRQKRQKLPEVSLSATDITPAHAFQVRTPLPRRMTSSVGAAMTSKTRNQ
jgi:hypothetical protein